MAYQPKQAEVSAARHPDAQLHAPAKKHALNLEALEPRVLLSASPLAAWQDGGVSVRAYDTLDDGVTPDVSGVRVAFGPHDTVSHVVIEGEANVEGLGISITGADRVGAVVDIRGVGREPLAFVASDAPVGQIVLRSDLTGAPVEAIGFPLDTPGESVGIYSAGDVGRVIVVGDVTGDVVTGGDLGVLYTTGDLTADVSVGGNLRVLRANGALTGDVSVEGTLNALRVHGDVVGHIRADTIGSAVVLGGTLASPDADPALTTTRNLGALVLRNGGALEGDVRVGGSARVIAVLGDLDARITIGLDLGRLATVGNVLSSPNDLPAVEVGRNLGAMTVYGALQSDVAVGGRLGALGVVGDVTADVTAGTIGSLTAVGDLTGHVSAAGDAGRLIAYGALASPDAGPAVDIAGDLRVLALLGGGAHLDAAVDVGGSLAHAIVDGDARAGSRIEATGRLGAVRIGGSLRGSADARVQILADDIGSLSVAGDVTGGLIGAGLRPEDGVLAPHSDAHFRPGSAIDRIDIAGALADSQIGAAEMGHHIRVQGRRTDPWAHDDIYSAARGTWGRHWRRGGQTPGSNAPTGGGDVADPVAVDLPDGGTVDAGELASWGIQLQGDLDGLKDSAYELVVVDHALGGGLNTAYTAAEVAAIQAEGKTVVAYFSIGEAEDYRFYWDESFESGEVDFLGPENPHWPGNYKVKYWDEDWWEVALQPTLDHIIAAGFDGVYLDIVDAYWYWGENGYAVQDTADAMVALVERISIYADDAAGAAFTVTPQNALGILHDASDGMRERYVDAIDSVGVESLFFNIWSPQDQAYRLQLLEQVEAAGKAIFAIEYIRPDQYDLYDSMIEASGLPIHGYAAAPDALLDEVVVRDAA